MIFWYLKNMPIIYQKYYQKGAKSEQKRVKKGVKVA